MSDKRFDFSRITRQSLDTRESLVDIAQRAKPHAAGGTFAAFLDGLPDQLAARDLRRAVDAVAKAFRDKRPVILGLGAHPIKVGLAPVLIDLVRRGIVTAIAGNGALVVHDYECAVAGKTSEDVAEALDAGTFGVTLETGRDLARFIAEGDAADLGLAESVARGLIDLAPAHLDQSLLAACVEAGATATVHVAIGTDVTHLAPELDFGALGRAGGRDFARFCAVVEDLEGGVYWNLGSAVVMPEVFLKAVAAARNVGKALASITTINMDFLRHYRPLTNVVDRPTRKGGFGCHITGHHEIMVPLFSAALVEAIENRG
ncbi:deoxyhypusine synthase family protein [bacterium]|nr:deoxyhypusine synthase family protein [bacterium]